MAGASEITAGALALGAAAQLYRDVLQPTLQKAGTAIAEVVDARVLAPMRGRVLSPAEAATVAAADVRARLAGANESELTEPPARVVQDVLEGLRTEASEPELRAMFANLLAGAMYAPTAPTVHPAFARVLREMSGEDAHLLRLVTDPDARAGPMLTESAPAAAGFLTRYKYAPPPAAPGVAGPSTWTPSPASVGNLKRLALVEDSREGLVLTERWHGKPFVGHPAERSIIDLTDFGRAFVEVCVRGPQIAAATSEASRG